MYIKHSCRLFSIDDGVFVLHMHAVLALAYSYYLRQANTHVSEENAQNGRR